MSFMTGSQSGDKTLPGVGMTGKVLDKVDDFDPAVRYGRKLARKAPVLNLLRKKSDTVDQNAKTLLGG